MSEQALIDLLRARGYKLTQARRAVIHVLASAATPLSVNDLFEQAHEVAADLGLVTVYRTLEVLEQLGLVRAVHLVENCHGYTIATPGHTHHVVCRQCNNVVEIAGCDLGAFLDEVMQRTGYRVTGHWLEVEGLCPVCQEQAEAGGRRQEARDK